MNINWKAHRKTDEKSWTESIPSSLSANNSKNFTTNKFLIIFHSTRWRKKNDRFKWFTGNWIENDEIRKFQQSLFWFCFGSNWLELKSFYWFSSTYQLQMMRVSIRKIQLSQDKSKQMGIWRFGLVTYVLRKLWIIQSEWKIFWINFQKVGIFHWFWEFLLHFTVIKVWEFREEINSSWMQFNWVDSYAFLWVKETIFIEVTALNLGILHAIASLELFLLLNLPLADD